MTTSASPGTYDIRIGAISTIIGDGTRARARPRGRRHDGPEGVTADQAALHRLLQRLRDLGVTLLGVTSYPKPPPPTDQPTIEETTMTTNQIITPDNLIRATGPFAISAGLIFAGIQPIHPPDFVASVTTMPWAVILTSSSLCACSSSSVRRALPAPDVEGRMLGLVAFVMFAGAWWLQASYVFAELFVLPPLASVSPELVDSFLHCEPTSRNARYWSVRHRIMYWDCCTCWAASCSASPPFAPACSPASLGPACRGRIDHSAAALLPHEFSATPLSRWASPSSGSASRCGSPEIHHATSGAMQPAAAH